MNNLSHSFILIALSVFTSTGCSERNSGGNMALPSSPSEDMSHLLVIPKSAVGEFDIDALRDYLPDPNIDWVVTIEFERTPSLPREKLKSLLDISWLEKNWRPTVYGYSPDEKHWTFVNALDSPKSFTSLKIAWSLYDPLDKKPKDISLKDLERLKSAVDERLSPLGVLSTKIERRGEDALAFVAGLSKIVAECDRDVTLVLAAPEGKRFFGRDIWDVMLCVGLKYGDLDQFHWINNSGFGDDSFFSVGTSTAPGYFIPQRIARGDGDVSDLIFGFSIPRSADPLDVFDSMANVVEYAQRRLGGEIVLESGKRFERTAERAKIEELVRRLRDSGFEPGESQTLRVF